MIDRVRRFQVIYTNLRVYTTVQTRRQSVLPRGRIAPGETFRAENFMLYPAVAASAAAFENTFLLFFHISKNTFLKFLRNDVKKSLEEF